MSFIELTLRGDRGEGVTVSVEHILTISTQVDPNLNHKQEPYTEITLAGPAHVVKVTESYAEVRKLIGLEVEE